MCESQSFETTVVKLRKDNRELRSEREGLLMKNKLLVDMLGGSVDLNGKLAIQKSIDHQAIGTSMSSLSGGDLKKAEREMADLKEQVDQLRDALQRIRLQNEALETEKSDMLTDIEQAAERELALEDQLIAETEEKNSYLKELEDFKESLRALFPSSQKESDLQAYLENIDRRESDLAERERYLDRREKLMEDRLASLNNRESELRHREANVEAKEDELLTMKKLEKKNSREQATGLQYERKDYQDFVGVEQGSVNSRMSRRHPNEFHETNKTLQDSFASGYDSHFERAKDLARKKKELLQESMAASKPMRTSESLSNMPSISQKFSDERIKLSNTIGKSNLDEEMAPSRWTKKSSTNQIDQGGLGYGQSEVRDLNKLTFNPSQMTDNGEMLIIDPNERGETAFEAGRSKGPGSKQLDNSDYRGMQESRYSQASKAGVPQSSMFEDKPELEDFNEPKSNKWKRKADHNPAKLEAEFAFEDAANDDEMEEICNEKHTDGPSMESGYQVDINQLQDNTVMESKVQQSAMQQADDRPGNPVTKKAVAFDLFDESIDEKKRELLIQKLERNRAQERHQVQKNNFLAEKRDQKSYRDKIRGENNSAASNLVEKNASRQNPSRLNSGIVGNPSTASKAMNRDSSLGKESGQDDSFQKKRIVGSDSQASKQPQEKGGVSTSPFLHHKKYFHD